MSSEAIILIARHFKNAALKNKAVVAITLFIGILLIYAAFSGWANYVGQNDISIKYQEQAQRDWESNPDKHPHRMAHYGQFAFRTKAPLSIFEFGMEPFFGNSIYLEAHKQNTANFSQAGFSNSILRFGEISIAMIVQVILPLLIFFLGYGSIASERENGTLKLLLSQGLSRKELITGKSVGLIWVILILFLPVMVLITFAWIFLQDFKITFDETIRLCLFIIIHCIYLVFFCITAVLVSAFSKTSKTALITLIGLWLVFIIVLPRGSQALGVFLYQAPSKIKFNTAVEKDIVNAGDSHNPDDPHFKKLKDSLLTAHKVSSTEELPFNYSGFIMAEGEKISAGIYNKHLEKVLDIYDKQNSFSKAVAFINPYMAVKNLSMAIADTDHASYVDFQQQAETYRYNMAQKLNALQIKHISNKKLAPTDKPYKIDKKHWAEIKPFEYKPRRIAVVLKNEIISITAITFWILLLFFMIRKVSRTLKVV
ncbi:MAG TPA: DUF3526 domain-containing protein [Flavobacterium sp.]